MPRDTPYSQQALSANDSTFSIEALEAAQQNSFDRILTQLTAQGAIQQNLETPTDASASPDGTPTLYVSSTGFASLFAMQPKMLYLSEGEGARTRPTNAIVDQIVLHSFGWDIDVAALRAGAKSIQVDSREVGHNPYKVYQHVQRALFRSRCATSHIITRRGDILSLCPWNRAPAVNAGGQAASLRVPERSISIELEAWWTGYNVDYRRSSEDEFKVLGLMPYTPEQLSALAFLVRKLGIWSSSAPTSPLGFTYADVSGLVGNASGHRAGIVNVSALDRARAGQPGGEFELPLDWKVGDAIPAHLDSALWQRRLQIYYGGYATGTQLSAYARLQQAYGTLPLYSMQTELFETRSTTLYSSSPPAVPGPRAAAAVAASTQGEGFARAETMQRTARAGFYEAAPTTADAVTIAIAQYTGTLGGVQSQTPQVPVIRNALAFDFAQGKWVLATTRVQAGPAGAPHYSPQTPPGNTRPGA